MHIDYVVFNVVISACSLLNFSPGSSWSFAPSHVDSESWLIIPVTQDLS